VGAGDVDRRLAGILAADVVGYSAMVGADEPGTLARVRTLRRDVIGPLLAAHSGRLFKTTGDGFFAAFASAVHALRCAMAIQDALVARTEVIGLVEHDYETAMNAIDHGLALNGSSALALGLGSTILAHAGRTSGPSRTASVPFG
jgi:class 3 adenylate cyclase